MINLNFYFIQIKMTIINKEGYPSLLMSFYAIYQNEVANPKGLTQ